MKISFTVYGNPKALKRHRTYTKDKRGRYLNRPRQVNPSIDDQESFLAQVWNKRPDKPLEQPIALNINCFFQRPKSHYRTGKYSHLLKKDYPVYHTSTPDCDNLIKFICDALNGIFWKDDRYIYSVLIQKFYDNTPRTEIVIIGL